MVMGTLSSLYIDTKNKLKEAGIEDYRFEASILLEHFTGIKVLELAALSEKTLDSETVESMENAIEKRISGYPLQYILGKWEFYGYPIEVGEGVLIPRPDTETLVEAVIQIAGESPKIVDLCSGSGCIAIALQKEIPSSTVYAVEMSEDALVFLKKNLVLNNSGVKLVCGDILDSEIIDNFEKNDIIVSNPPYLTDEDMNVLQKEVKHEPKMALEGGKDGLYFYREITKLWKSKLKIGGILAYEVGMGQELDVAEILKQNRFSNIEFKEDLSGITRVVYGELF